MRVILEGIADVEPRSHPYDFAHYDSRVRHYDFVKHPELIRQVLEDFTPWEKYGAVESFYQLLEWINGRESGFESSDCRLEPPQANSQSDYKFDLVLQGRLMILFREMPLNFAEIPSEGRFFVSHGLTNLIYSCNDSLTRFREDIWWSYFQLLFFSARYRPTKTFGHQLTLQFNCFGDCEEDLFDCFNIIVKGIQEAMKEANITLV